MLETLTNISVVLSTITSILIWTPILIPKYMKNRLCHLFIAILSLFTTGSYALRVVYTDNTFVLFGMIVWLLITISYFNIEIKALRHCRMIYKHFFKKDIK